MIIWALIRESNEVNVDFTSYTKRALMVECLFKAASLLRRDRQVEELLKGNIEKKFWPEKKIYCEENLKGNQKES